VAEANERRLTGGEQGEALAELEAEHGNLRAAIRWSLDHEPTTAARLCVALWRFWWIRGHLSEGRRWLGAVVGRPQDDPALYARALTGAGVLARSQGDYGAAVQLLDRGAALARSIDDRRTLALALINVGNVAEDQGGYERARTLFEEAQELYAELGDGRGVGHSLNCLGTIKLIQGDLEGSTALFEQALSMFRSVDDDWSVAMVFVNLGWGAHRQGRNLVARSLYEKGLGMYRLLGDDRAVAHMLVNLAIAIRTTDVDADVKGLFEEALLTFARLGERRGVVDCLEALAAARSECDPAGAACLLSAAGALRRDLGAPLRPDDEAEQAAALAFVRDRLGAGAFDAAWQAGRVMEIDEVVAVALTGRDGLSLTSNAP
jgi:tetratricopeptide (TPR) repeat protein